MLSYCMRFLYDLHSVALVFYLHRMNAIELEAHLNVVCVSVSLVDPVLEKLLHPWYGGVKDM